MLAIVLALSYFAAHASNAVHWVPWGDAAFAKAKAEDKPIFLSIGYASCHWCHVMERESFQDPALGAFINANFVPVLVDRDEHPDVDETYMAFVAAANNGNAGWPANLVITSDRSPILGATFLSNDALHATLAKVLEKWKSDRASLLVNGAAIVAAAREEARESSPADAVSPRIAQNLYELARSSFDRENGGFGTAPKFPQPFLIDFLLRRNDKMAITSLDAMARGAIQDQIGGGFHRYAVDASWRTPHYEKMLTDQALLSMLYLEAWQLTKRDDYARVVRRTLDFTLRELKLKNGAFGAGEDADSLAPIQGPAEIEGAHYLWTRAELRQFLGKDGDWLADYFGLNAGSHPVYVARPEEAKGRDLDAAIAKLQLVQSHRPLPKLDDTVVTSWNALMISALARAGAALGDEHYLYAAKEAIRAIDAKTHAHGVPAFAEDYAFVIQANLDLFDATSNVAYLTRAIELQQRQDELFWNGTTLRYDGGSTLPPSLRGATLERDGDIPSASSVAASNLIRLSILTDSEPMRAKADAIFRSFAPRMNDLPFLVSTFVAAQEPPREVVIVGDVTRDETKAMIRLVHEKFDPLRAFFVVANEKSRGELAAYAPFLKEMKPIDEKLPTVFVCDHYTCKAPTTDIHQVARLLSIVDAEVGKNEAR